MGGANQLCRQTLLQPETQLQQVQKPETHTHQTAGQAQSLGPAGTSMKQQALPAAEKESDVLVSQPNNMYSPQQQSLD